MFNKTDVETILTNLKNNVGFFASEAHFQMSFAAEILKEYKDRFVIIPEFPTKRKIDINYVDGIEQEEKTDEIDLVVIDTNDKDDNGNYKKTFIEFKHKTANTTSESLIVPVKNIPGLEIIPTAMQAQDLGRFDCWSDIERLEYYKNKKECANAFFILITNDKSYWRKNGEHGFGIKEESYIAEDKKWSYWDSTLTREVKKEKELVRYVRGSVPEDKKKSVDANRNRVIKINNKYNFYWKDFIEVQHNRNKREVDCGLYRRLIVKI